MIARYTFASDDEPTEEQLAELMHEVALDAKERAVKAEKKLMDELRQAIQTAFKQLRDESHA